MDWLKLVCDSLGMTSLFGNHMELEHGLEEKNLKSKSSLWLVLFCQPSMDDTSMKFFKLQAGKLCAANSLMVHKSTCWPNPQGWMLVKDWLKEYNYLLDPITMMKKRLPQVSSEFEPEMYVMSSSPNDPNCKMLCADVKKSCLYFYKNGDEEWICHQYNNLGNNNDLSHIIAVEDKFYGITAQSNFVVIEGPPNPHINILELINVDPPTGIGCFTSHLVESCGEIFLVRRYYAEFRMKKTIHFSITRRDSSSKSAAAWETVDNINGCVFLVAGEGSISSWSATDLGLKGDCVYFFEDHNKKYMFCFDIQEGFISVYQSCPGIECAEFTPIWMAHLN